MGTRPLSLRTGLLIVATGLLLIGGGCAMVVKAFFKEKQSAPKVISAVAAETKDYLLIEGYIVTVDPVTGRMELELYFHPRGRFDAGQGLLAVPLEVEVSSIGGEPLMFEAGRRMFPQAVEFGFWDGSVADYPIDLHQVQIELRVLEATGGDGPRVVVPVKLEMDAHFHGLAVSETALPEIGNGYIGTNIQLKRSPLVIGTVGFCMAVMWALTIMNLLMLWAVLTRRMEVDVELFAYMSGMIVALYFFREVLPDAPPFLGVFADYAAFFWAELITAACSVIFALIWYRQLIKSPPGVTTPPWGERGA
jgi:hypothetical protein